MEVFTFGASFRRGSVLDRRVSLQPFVAVTRFFFNAMNPQWIGYLRYDEPIA